MLLEEIMEVDLSIVKKEKLELEDYGQNTGNILDNFLSEHDYNSFPESVPTVVSCFYLQLLILCLLWRKGTYLQKKYIVVVLFVDIYRDL